MYSNCMIELSQTAPDIDHGMRICHDPSPNLGHVVDDVHITVDAAPQRYIISESCLGLGQIPASLDVIYPE